ncbi:MAG TPA: DUF1365 domain-containing protein [Caulobacteraceae bacterium]|nr:DUF1365 domain-containing protein [Caulobacteraceae bacterium]
MSAPAFVSGLYAGVVGHVRLRPVRHALRYRVFMLLLDLDELDRLDRDLALLKINRPGLLSLYERDHLDGGPALKARVRAVLVDAGLPADGRIQLMCMPRVLGFVFNPISLYFCHDAEDRLAAMLYEVNNTFGQRHSYLIPVAADGTLVVEQDCDKRLFVSPFMGMDMRYRFRIEPPRETVRVKIDGDDADGPLIVASFIGRRRELSDRAIVAALLGHPLLTLMVVAGIHWEALKLLIKGVRLRPRPAAPPEPVTVVHKAA